MRKLILALGLFFALPAQAADINVATVGPMTGPNASKGEQMRRGAEMAVADINAAGGVNGKKLALAVGDDVCDPKQAVSVANQMISRGMVFVAGHYCSGSSIPAAPLYAEEGVLQMSPGSTNPQLTEQGLDTTFRICGRDDQQGPVSGNYILQHFKGQNVAVLHDKSAYGKGIADQVKDVVEKATGKPVAMYDAYTAGDKDFNALVARMKKADIAVVFLGGSSHLEIGLIVRQMREAGLKAQVMGGDSLMTSEFWSITGDAGEGVLMTFGPDPRNQPQAKAVVDRFRAQHYEPEGYTLYTYAAFQAWAQAAKTAGKTDATAVSKALKNGTFDTVIGPVGFDSKGDVKAPTYVIYKWSKGQFSELK